jgi:hypothetical protein
MILSIAQQGYLFIKRPYLETSLNFINLFNEFAVSVYLYLMFLLTDYITSNIDDTDTALDEQQEFRLKVAWALTGVTLGSILVNTLYALSKLINSLYIKI